MKRARKKSIKQRTKKVASSANFVPPWAHPPPAIIHTLRVLLNPAAFPPGQADWVKDGVRTTLKGWDAHEDIAQLKRDLGLVGRKRRKGLTVRREFAICMAIEKAALEGSANPKQCAGDTLDADEREVQRAWSKWNAAIYERLYLMKARVSTAAGSAKIQLAMKLLKYPGDTN